MARCTSTLRAAERNNCDTVDRIDEEVAVHALHERVDVSTAAAKPAVRGYDPVGADAERMTGPPHSPHRAVSQAALDVARRLFAAADDTGTDDTRAGATPTEVPDDARLIASAERIGSCVPDGLARWFGPYGSLALVTRALASAEASHPALGAVRVSSSPAPRLIGVSESAQRHGAAVTADAVITLLATLYELLGRLIGDDMALVLLGQCVAPSASQSQARPSNGERVARSSADPASGGEGARDAQPTDEELSQTMDAQ